LAGPFNLIELHRSVSTVYGEYERNMDLNTRSKEEIIIDCDEC